MIDLTRFGNFPLLLALAGAVLLNLGGMAMTPGATDTQLKQGRRVCFVGQRLSATPAQFMRPGLEAMAHRDAFIKHKAFAFPQTLRRWHFFEVFQNTAFQMENLVKAVLKHQ